MQFGSPAGIPGFPSFVLCHVKSMGWCLCDGAGSLDPVKVGEEFWFRTKRDMKRALDPIRDTHAPWATCGGTLLVMKPRPN